MGRDARTGRPAANHVAECHPLPHRPPEPSSQHAAEHTIRAAEIAAAGAAIGVAARFGPRITPVLLDRVLALFARRHPRAYAAMAELPRALVLLDPADQPAALALEVGPRVRLALVARDSVSPDAAVRGPLAALMDLLQGRIDGDALFFRRELRIEGDTALVVALRNALDGEDIDLAADVAAALGPAGVAVPLLRRGFVRAVGALESVRSLLLAPVEQRLERMERRVARLDRSAER